MSRMVCDELTAFAGERARDNKDYPIVNVPVDEL
jgi:hypothetical protein